MRKIVLAGVALAALAAAAPASAQYASQEVASTTVVNQANALGFGDDQSQLVNLGFDFDFYGTSYSQAFISSNGLLSFTSNANGCCSGQDLGASPAAPNAVVAGYWVDLYPPSNQGISYGTTGAAGSRIFTTSYNGVPFYGNTRDSATFSISLFEGSNNILLNYNRIGQLANYTVSSGIENADGTAGLTIFHGPSEQSNLSNRGFLIGTNLTAAVPEPSAWALMILGFGLVGASMRRSRTATVIFA